MTRTGAGIIFGIIAGVVDVIPMVVQGLTWDANLSAFSLWVVSGFLIATTSLELPDVAKGILIPFLVLLPSVFIIGWAKPLVLVPIAIMTFFLGAVLGVAIGRVGKT